LYRSRRFVDIASEESFYDMLTNLRERYKMTILLVSHDIGVVSSLVDEILCLNQTLFVHGPPGEAGASDWFAQAYGGGRIVNHAHHSHGKGQSCG